MERVTFDEFKSDVDAVIHQDWRPGQTAFNLLMQTKPALAEAVRAGPSDPFYVDARLPAFWRFVAEYWDVA